MTILFDKAAQYARDVLDGKEITTKEVKKQCEWFFADLERQNEDSFAYEIHEKYLEPIEGILSLMNFATGLGTQGLTILEGLRGFQSFFLVNVFGWRFKNEPTRFRYRQNVLFIPRKNAKTFLTSVILLILLLTEDNYSEFYSICLDRELATEVKKAMTQIIQASPAIEPYFKISNVLSGKITCKLTHSYYQARTSDANRNNAIRPAAYIADEVGAFTDYSNLTAMQSGQLNVKNPLRFFLTTAYAEDRSIMLEELSYIRKVYAGVIEDDRLFSLIYYADEKNLWTDEGLYMANPLRIPENYKEIQDSRKQALEMPLKRAEYLCKHMNHFLPSMTGEAFIEIDQLRKCKIESFDWRNRPIWVGLDLSLTNDNTSVSFVTEEMGKIYAESFAFVPQDRIDEKNRLEKINYYEFIKHGKCFSCGDLTISYSFVEDFIMSLEDKYGVTIQGISFDRYNALSTIQRLEREKGFRVVETRQHSSTLHAPTKLLKEKILSGDFHYTDNPLLEINFMNARETRNNNMDSYVNKKKSNGKVDQVVSLINSIYLLQQDVIFNPDSDWGALII